jgi:hypothetical protein
MESSICEYCGALRFSSETPTFCCRKGKVQIYMHDLPFEIRRLFDSQTDCDAKYFINNIRYFNSHFSFTSFGAMVDECTATTKGIYRLYALFYFFYINNFMLIVLFYLNIGTGIYAFKVHGQIYHKIDQLIHGGKGPRHMQLYFYDTDESMVHRRNRSPHLNQNLIQEILQILSDVAKNPYIHISKTWGNQAISKSTRLN